MKDSASQPPVVIQRADYRPPAWLVPDIALDFVLDLTETRVSATLDVERNPAGDGGPLRLNGDGMVAQSVAVDGEPHNAWAMEGDDLVIDLPGEAIRSPSRPRSIPPPIPSFRASMPRAGCCARSARPKASAASPSSPTGPMC
jgi:aminopeptidase N